jgi:hypothetical protein
MIPAVIVGALTAWYLGLRIGVMVAIATAVALLVATVIPGMTITVYALVIAWAAAMYFFGPKIAKASGKGSLFGSVGATVGSAGSWVRSKLRKPQ